jgi:hypothetical protein
MIILSQNSQNPVTVTVSELQQGTGSLFLWEFINGTSKVSSYTLAYDSASLNRYNRFCITTTGSNADSTQGQVYLPLLGQYLYNVYEDPSGSLSPTGLNLCEMGKMTLVSSSAVVTAFTGSTSQYIVYNNNGT